MIAYASEEGRSNRTISLYARKCRYLVPTRTYITSIVRRERNFHSNGKCQTSHIDRFRYSCRRLADTRKIVVGLKQIVDNRIT